MCQTRSAGKRGARRVSAACQGLGFERCRESDKHISRPGRLMVRLEVCLIAVSSPQLAVVWQPDLRRVSLLIPVPGTPSHTMSRVSCTTPENRRKLVEVTDQHHVACVFALGQ
jgi:hypothetical protein